MVHKSSFLDLLRWLNLDIFVLKMGASESRTTAYVNAGFSVALLISSLAISAYHFASIYRQKRVIFGRKFLRSNPSILFSYILCFVAVISGVSLTLDSILTNALCPYAQFYGPTLYSLFKTVVYLILGVRIWRSFKHSIYEYDSRKLIIWGVILSCWTLFNVVAGNLTVTHKVEHDHGATKCVVNPSILYIASQAMLDLIAGTVSCVLFVSPICKLYKASADMEHADARKEALKIKGIAHRQCILSMIAIISSIVAMAGLGAMPSSVPVFVSMDMFLSTACVILMYKWNTAITTKLFWCCIPTMSAASNVVDETTDDNGVRTVVPSAEMTDVTDSSSLKRKSKGNGTMKIKPHHVAGQSSTSMTSHIKLTIRDRPSQTEVSSQQSMPSAGSIQSVPSGTPGTPTA